MVGFKTEKVGKLFFGFLVCFLSCSQVEPGDFWSEFKKIYLVQNTNDLGPFGGHRAMHWKAFKPDTFTEKDILNFASKNGWKLSNVCKVKPSELKTWKYNNQPIFPLSFSGFTDPQANIATFSNFPRWINSEVKVYKFKTGWITIMPGSDESTEENGFVLVNLAGNEMSVYHLWGE